MAEARAAGRALAGLVGLGCAGVAAWLALHHPLSAAAALAGVALLAAAQAAWPPLWLVALPALLPWLGLGAWTGWVVVEEMDLAILAVAAGAYLRWALQPGARLRASRDSRRVRAWGQLLLLAWTVLVLVALLRGVADAGGWAFGWWQGLREPLAALRLAKPTLAVLLLLPLWWRLQQQPGQRCADQLGWGMTLALAGISLWCLWERAAFTGLLDMASDYRTTGPFWEMRFGGAALDVGLALTLPFALRQAWQARSPAALAGSSLVLLGGVYAALTTFSRIVYLAVPVAALLWWWLQRRQQQAAGAPAAAGALDDAAPAPDSPAAVVHGHAPLLLPALGVAALGAWMFPSAGYRGLLALLGNVVLLLLLVPRSTGQPPAAWVGAWLGGLALAGLAGLVATWLPKGVYLVYAAASLAGAGLLLAPPPRQAPVSWLLAGVCFVAQLVATVLVAVGWGGSTAAPAAAAAAVALAAAWQLLGTRPSAPWPASLPAAARQATGMAVLLAAVAVFSAGPYMATRVGQSGADGAGRWQHWRDGLALNGGGLAWWLGEGLGRYADLYALRNRPETRPGDIRLVPDGPGQVMRLVAGNHTMGNGERLRLSQRIGLPPGPGLRVVLQVRTAGPASLQLELCHKHLLYPGQCNWAQAVVKPLAQAASAVGAGSAANAQPPWQTVEVPLQGAGNAADGMPRFSVFSVASETRAQPVELRSLQLLDAGGRPWLRNPDFADGGAHWFSTSDRVHQPWHAKNMGVHLLVEQGLLGLLVLAALALAALSAVLGPLRRHPLAPALVAAVVGCWVVGAVDSVLDLPRVATWLLLLNAMALQLHLPGRAARQAQRLDTKA